MKETLIELKDIQKYYPVGKEKFHVLKSINLEIKSGEFVMIMGKSGSGKTTLLNILGFLDRFSDGKYIFKDNDVTNLNEKERSKFRNNNIGFVFQQFNLITNLNIYKNVELPMVYSNSYSKEERELIIKEKLNIVGILDKINQKPLELSGGQQQRVTIARALVNDPDIIFADEPTGALDSDTSKDIMDILKGLNKKGKTIIMVTHDPDLIKYATKIIKLKDGVVVEED
ncbi:ABC transporter family protein [[Clostridium] bifermentans ATCC 638]|uniref:ABC transporter family protein n=1 Tax=Paraclostridium bifermentans ATCC 638 = DSM 14991 TaxID=1233171 RepID=T4VSH6_PARBF|nr:ABC transporter ATP-binding protein [Paraclostridium bifermentans]EQK44080.1 ABC transporter family protein [[Clostridium] bifermentans ATCC 638] [Paraclostridium bifermentans ATCC 638 = DSM 14991]RIZ58517.1 ABC transporter ATP-binding protein [Paraclostridium bifermentans]UAG19820.1 ABC transporter ATP-binding protein [Paraclostridium bifermentans]UOW69499.1 ABC transporter ATP-binding protein [Paraclostridium bifermentans]